MITLEKSKIRLKSLISRHFPMDTMTVGAGSIFVVSTPKGGQYSVDPLELVTNSFDDKKILSLMGRRRKAADE